MAGIQAGRIVTVADLVDGIGIRVMKSIDESVTSNTTLQDDDELRLPVESFTNYDLGGYLGYTAASGANIGGFKFTFTVPSGATLLWSSFGTNVSVTPATDYDATANAAAVTRSMAGNSGQVMAAQPRGTLIVGSTAGFIQCRWAQHASNATATVVKAGSLLTLQKV